jgi:hypothetical protein
VIRRRGRWARIREQILSGDAAHEARERAHLLQLQIDAFAAGYERAQLDAGADPADPVETGLRLRAAAAYYIGQQYRAANPGIGAGRIKSASFEGGKPETGPDA